MALTNLDGSGFLNGEWATVVSATGNPAYSPTNTFVYTGSDDEFEQVMAYYWVTQAQKYIQTLGFGGDAASGQQAVASSPHQPVRRSTTRSPRATSRRSRFGKGGVDDAEDAEVIVHEYGTPCRTAETPFRLRHLRRGGRDRRGIRRLLGRRRSTQSRKLACRR